ncbi:hypothetical protein BH09PLA1_BH09PLA1_21240 [soil metagenome]
MQRISSFTAFLIPLTFAFGCATKTYTFQIVDAETHQPMRDVHIGYRDVRTMPDDDKKVLFFLEIWHPVATGSDGIFQTTVENSWWHVLHFCPPDCGRNDGIGHMDAFVTISPEPISVQIGDWPKQGSFVSAEGVIVVELETYRYRNRKRPSTLPASRQSAP